ncbi:MAG: hypothetical protein LBI61_01975 [Puniceicoccales bacterium]|jgi:hypothetical protein|nr:hypothetical protein [Puniceicoccales bacterium]
MTQLILSNSEIGSHTCNIAKRAETAIETKYLLGKLVPQSLNVAICGEDDLPIGIITDEAEAPTAGKREIVNVSLLGSSDTLLAVASEAIQAGDIIVPAADGKVKPLPIAPGIYAMVGIALTGAAGANQRMEFMSCVPQQHVVQEV